MFDKLKSLFIEESGEEKKDAGITPPTVESKESSAPTVESPTPEHVPKTSSAREGNVDSKFLGILFGAMEKNNLEGFDYLEFKQSLKSLNKMPMDEPTKYKSAFAMAQTMGATPEKLIQAADHYLKILQVEEKKFAQAVVNQRTRQIGDKEAQIKQLNNVILQKSEQIKKLTQEIEQHQKQMESLKDEIAQAAGKVESTQMNFKASYEALVGQIRKDKANMSKYLK